MVANRTRTNDPAMHKDVAARAHIKINPPKSMSRHAKKHFREIIGRRANLDWNEHDISTAVVLAEMMALCQQQQVILARELEENPEEDPNPQRLKLISESSSKIIQFRRTLNIHQAGGGHQALREAQRREANVKTQNVVRLAHNRADRSDLLAKRG